MAVIGLCGLAIILSLHMIRQEAMVASAEARLALLDKGTETGGGRIVPPADAMRPDGPPRAVLANALFLTRVAQRDDDDPQMRDELFDRALAQLRSIEDVRPYWGELWSTRAYAQSARPGLNAADVRASLDRSYRDAPYLNRAAPWRVAYGFANWNDLDDTTRDRMLNEAVWLARSDPAMLDPVLSLARQSPAYRDFVVRWVAVRRGDRDFRPLQGTAP